MRRDLLVGMLVALIGGFAISRLATLLELGSVVVLAATCGLILALLLVQMHRIDRSSGRGRGPTSTGAPR